MTSTRKTAKRETIVVPGREHMCGDCGCNLEAWRYAFASEYLRLRLAYFGPEGYIRRYERSSVWRMYDSAMRELQARLRPLVAAGVFSHRCTA